MKKLISALVFLSFLAISNQNFAQTLFTVSGEPISKSEFESVFRKNVSNSEKMDEEVIREYLNRYIIVKLKVREARDLGLDTTVEFKNEYNEYRDKLASQYLIDKEVIDKLVLEAYERSKWEVNASHILLMCDPNASPTDTLAVYKRIMDIRKMAVSKTKDFADLAREFSEEPNAQQSAGNLGYFSSLRMVYPFENAAFNTKIGEVSMPIRTRFGYHLIRVNDKREALGEITVAHIMIAPREDDPNEDKRIADSLYVELKKGADFEAFANQFSDDSGSASRGGVLPAFGSGVTIPDFEKAAFALSADGEISQPIQTMYGWHIIKRISKRATTSFDEIKGDLRNRVQRDSRSELNRQTLVSRVKKENNFKENAAVVKPLIDKFKDNANKNTSAELFKLAGKSYLKSDFITFMKRVRPDFDQIDNPITVKEVFNQFVTDEVIKYEKSTLESKYPEFKALSREYYDGILLFTITNKNVWEKSVTDSIGLQEFYASISNNFMQPERLNVDKFICNNEKIAKNVRKQLKNTNVDAGALIASVNAKDVSNVTWRNSILEKGKDAAVDKLGWNKGVYEIKENGKTVFVRINAVIPPEPMPLENVKSQAINAYQEYLEKKWIERLRAKYPVEVITEVYNTLKIN